MFCFWQSSKAAFQALIYPAIPNKMDLGKQTPPAFLACGEDDRVDISQGMPELYLATERTGCRRNCLNTSKPGIDLGCARATMGRQRIGRRSYWSGWVRKGFQRGSRCGRESREEHDGPGVPCPYESATTDWVWSPRPWMPSSILSPGTRYLGGFWPMPTPGGVPVEMMSPGWSDMKRLR